VIDTALDPSHPDLEGGVIECFDMAGDAEPRRDSHGTEVARLIRMMAPECRIVGFNVFPDQKNSLSFGYDGSVRKAAAKAVQHCIDRWPDIRIVNMSLAIPRGRWWRCTPERRCRLCRTVNTAREKGILPVAAAGNTGPHDDTVECPGCAEGATAVGAVLSAKDRAAYQQASGKDRANFGTSFSAAYHSGAAAMLMSRFPEGTPDDIDQAIGGSGNKLPNGMLGRPNYLIALARLIGPEEASVEVCLERIAAVAGKPDLQTPDNKALRSAIEVMLLHIDRGLLRTGDKAGALAMVEYLDRSLRWESYPEFASQMDALRPRVRL
jgi:hypothetical protein